MDRAEEVPHGPGDGSQSLLLTVSNEMVSI
jgi:hypothetical protein